MQQAARCAIGKRALRDQVRGQFEVEVGELQIVRDGMAGHGFYRVPAFAWRSDSIAAV